MIANGGYKKCGSHYENVCLQIGDYFFKAHMLCIEIMGSNIALGEKWLHKLVPLLWISRKNT